MLELIRFFACSAESDPLNLGSSRGNAKSLTITGLILLLVDSNRGELSNMTGETAAKKPSGIWGEARAEEETVEAERFLLGIEMEELGREGGRKGRGMGEAVAEVRAVDNRSFLIGLGS